MIDTQCQDWAERSHVCINHQKERSWCSTKPPSNEPPQPPSHFTSPLASPYCNLPNSSFSGNPPPSKYLGLTLHPWLSIVVARNLWHIYRKINLAHETVAVVALRYVSPATGRGIRSRPYSLFRILQPCVLGFATENLPCLVTNAQINAVEHTLIHSLQCTLHYFTSPHISASHAHTPTGTQPPHLRHTVLHTGTFAAKLYNLRCKFHCGNAHPQYTIEKKIVKAHSTLMIRVHHLP